MLPVGTQSAQENMHNYTLSFGLDAGQGRVAETMQETSYKENHDAISNSILAIV